MACSLLAAPVAARDLAVLSDKTAKITVPEKALCRTTAPFKVEASTATFYEQRLVDLGSLFGAALNTYFAGCSTVTAIKITGYIGKTKIINASSKADDGWQLRLERPLFEQVAQSIPEKITSFEQLSVLNALFDPYKNVSGIAQTSGYQVFAQNAKTAVDRLTFGDPAKFDNFATDLLDKPKTTAAKALDEALSIVALYNPSELPRLRNRFQALEQEIVRAELEEVVLSALRPEKTLQDAAGTITKQLKSRTYSPLQVEASDRAVADWFEKTITRHDEAHSGDDLETAAAHVALLNQLEKVPTLSDLPVTQAALEDAIFWYQETRDEILVSSLQIAKEILQDTGENYTDVGLILETGSVLSEEFEAYGFNEEAEYLSTEGVRRAATLIEQNLPPYVAQINTLEMTRDTIAELEFEKNAFAGLAEDFPTFEKYADAVDEAVIAGRLRACTRHLHNATNDTDLEKTILVEDRILTLQSLACELYDNGHILERFTTSDRAGKASLEIDIYDEGLVPFDLASLDLGGGLTTYEFILDEDANLWADRFSELVIKPPTGKPDRNGVTECDLLAGDPNDSSLPTDGVILEQLDAEYDFDRALDACIAAVEYDANPRQVFQLARLLEFLGDGETAAPYIDAAAASKYPPALHLKATYTLTYDDDDDAFFDAIDLYKEASVEGYAPSKKELSELIPPGTDLFRESPPPSDSEIMNVVDKRRCEGAAGFSVCATKTSVSSKKCFQTSATEFSCELRFSLRCSTGNHPLMQLFGGMVRQSCPSRTDPLFLKFTKSGSSWRYRNEF